MENCDVFISRLDSHSDGTHSLQRIHWWASEAKQNLFPWTTNSSTFWTAWHFWVNYSLKAKNTNAVIICCNIPRQTGTAGRFGKIRCTYCKKKKGKCWANYFANHTLHNLQRSHVPVLQVFGFDLSHLPAGEVKHLLTEELQDDHVVLTQALAGATRSHNVTDERGPVLRPLLLQNLHANRKTSTELFTLTISWLQICLKHTHLHQDHVELCYVNPFLL